MGDIKQVERLEDWFDGAVILGRADALAASLAARLPVHRLASPPAPDAYDAALLELGIKRPLLIVAETGFDALLLTRPEPFRVADPAAGSPADLVISLTDPAGAEAAVIAAVRAGLAADKRLNILVLYNDRYTHVQSTLEHLAAFGSRSRHNVFFMPAAETPPSQDPRERMFDHYDQAWPDAWDLSRFDVVVWHYVLPAYKTSAGWISDYMAHAVARRLAAYDGLKILFAQDEYDSTATIWKSIRDAGIHLVMTCVPAEGVSYVYPPAQLPGVEFLQTLAGFVPDDQDLARFALPMRERNLRLAYRGRVLPFRYGHLAREKYKIGLTMKALAAERGVAADIDVTESARIYGEDWYRFLGSARAMLATESGSNVFDFDGSLNADEAEAQAEGYEAYHARRLAPLEGKIQMNQASPKIFEAIGLRTALVCFEGRYSDIIRPDEHFIPLKKDFSNSDEVFAKLEDLDALEAMTERAYHDVIQSGAYGYAAFVQRFDGIVGSRVVRPPRGEFVSAPILWRPRGWAAPQPIVRLTPFDYILNTGVLGGGFQRRELDHVMAAVREAEVEPRRPQSPTPPSDARPVVEYGPDAVVCYEYWRNAGARAEREAGGARITTPAQAWHYAAGVRLDLSLAKTEHEHAWVRLRLREVVGELRVGFYDGDKDRLVGETILSPGSEPQTVFLPVVDLAANLLLFRTGQFEAAASGLFLDAAIVAAPAYPPSVIAVARSLAALPPGALDWWRPAET